MSSPRLGNATARVAAPPLLFSGCTGTSVGHVYPHFVTITRRHRIAPPRQCDLLCRCRRRRRYRRCRRHRHCGHHHLPHSAFSFAPWRSPSAGKLCSGCAGASFVGHVHPCFVAITRRHRIAPPQQRDPHVAVAAAATATIIAVASPLPLWQPPPWRHAATDTTHKTVPLRCRRFREAKWRYAEGIGQQGVSFLGGSTVLICCYIHTLLVNTNNMTYIFDTMGGKQGRACSLSATTSNNEQCHWLLREGHGQGCCLLALLQISKRGAGL